MFGARDDTLRHFTARVHMFDARDDPLRYFTARGHMFDARAFVLCAFCLCQTFDFCCASFVLVSLPLVEPTTPPRCTKEGGQNLHGGMK